MEHQTQIAPISGDLSLRESELRYRRLFEAAQDGILILDAATGAITDVNPFLISLLGFSLGVANFPKDGSTGAAVLMAADAALYRAKHDRRQRLDAVQ